jgi:hypothetical protein
MAPYVHFYGAVMVASTSLVSAHISMSLFESRSPRADIHGITRPLA